MHDYYRKIESIQVKLVFLLHMIKTQLSVSFSRMII